MKRTLFASTIVFVCGAFVISRLTLGGPFVATSQVDQQAAGVSVLQEQPSAAPQEVAPPAPAASPSDAPPSVLQAPAGDGWLETPLYAPGVAAVPAAHCGECCCTPCCCPVPTELCLVEPECCCSYEICVHLPPCCVGEAPQVSWRNGILGRKIAHLCWPCCGKRVKVVIPAFGKPRVWE
jgi:hypothetical protein